MDSEKLKKTEWFGEPTRQSLEEPGSIDFTLPREAWSVDELTEPAFCPRCRASLQPSYQSYVVATREESQAQDGFLWARTASVLLPATPHGGTE